MAAVVTKLDVCIDLVRQQGGQGVGGIKLLVDFPAGQGPGDDGELPRVGAGFAAAARLQGADQAVHVLEVQLVTVLILRLTRGRTQQHTSLARAAEAIQQGGSFIRRDFITEIDSRKLTFEGTAQVVHRTVQQLVIFRFSYHTEVQIDAGWPAFKEIQQAYRLFRVHACIDVCKRLPIGLVPFVVDFIQSEQANLRGRLRQRHTNLQRQRAGQVKKDVARFQCDGLRRCHRVSEVKSCQLPHSSSACRNSSTNCSCHAIGCRIRTFGSQ